VAERLQVTEHTVYQWIARRKLRAVKLGRLWRVSETALQALLEEEPGSPVALGDSLTASVEAARPRLLSRMSLPGAGIADFLGGSLHSLAERFGHLLTPAQVAERLQVTEHTVYQWIREGKLRAVRISRLLRIPEKALAELLEAGSKPSEDPSADS
jgi:excisionase family DNA binding protein